MGCSSTGRATDSDSVGSRFDPSHPSQCRDPLIGGSFFAWDSAAVGWNGPGGFLPQRGWRAGGAKKLVLPVRNPSQAGVGPATWDDLTENLCNPPKLFENRHSQENGSQICIFYATEEVSVVFFQKKVAKLFSADIIHSRNTSISPNQHINREF